MDCSRRQWLAASLSAAAWPEIIAAQQEAQHAMQSSPRPAFGYLDPTTATEIEALAGQIIPSGDTPGAHEAGVVYFHRPCAHDIRQRQA